MKMKIADKRHHARPDRGHERVQGRQREPARNGSGNEHEITIDRPRIAHVAQQDHDEDSRERQLQSDAEDVHLFPSQKGRSSGVARADLVRGRYRAVATRLERREGVTAASQR